MMRRHSVFPQHQSQHMFQMYTDSVSEMGFICVLLRQSKERGREMKWKNASTATLDAAELLVKPTTNEALNYLTLLPQILI